MSTPTVKANWTPPFHKMFVELCLREVLKTNVPGTRISKEGWRNILGSFYAKTGVRYDKKQFKNHYDSTRKLWKVWVKLIGDSSMKWDPETNKFGASEEDWCNYIKENPEAAQFQSKGIQFKDELDIIFDGGIPTEEIKNSISLNWQDDALATPPLLGKEGGKKRKRVGRDDELDTPIMVNSSPSPKATWTPAFHKIFVDLCLEETLKGKKSRTHFTKEGWRNIMGSFYAKTGVRYDKRQIKNHYDSTRKLWKIWAKLISDDRMKWDPETNKFGASDEDWHSCIKAIPEAAQFMFKEIQFSDKLGIIFGDSKQNEEMRTSALLKRRHDASDTSPSSDTSQSSDTSPLYEERGKKHMNVDEEFDSKNAILVHATPISAIAIEQSMSCSPHLVHATPISMIASEQSMSCPPHPRVKATWTPSVHRIFIELCLEETLKGNKPGTHFTKEGWKNIMKSFYLKTGLNYDRIQFKNHWDSTKDQWKIWCKLVCTSYMKWNPANHKFEATEEDWAKYLQANPEAAQFYYKELQLTDMLETIFNGTTVTGETQPAVQQRKSDDSVNTVPMHAKEPDITSLHEKTECLCDAVASRNGMSIQTNANAISSTETKRSYSIGECIECLDGMEGIEQGSDLYLFALDVFLRQEHREIFLQLKKPNLRISWLQRLRTAGQSSV